MGQFEPRRVERVLGAEEIGVVVDEMGDFLLPVAPQLLGLAGLSILLEGVDHVRDDDFVVGAGRVGRPRRMAMGTVKKARAVPKAHSR